MEDGLISQQTAGKLGQEWIIFIASAYYTYILVYIMNCIIN
jgi:hypothetical protein